MQGDKIDPIDPMNQGNPNHPSDRIAALQLSDAKYTLQAKAGELILLSGDVGSGKSLCLKRLAGLLAWPKGVSLHESPNVVRMFFDRVPCVWLGGSVAEELIFGLKHTYSEAVLANLLSQWGLSDVALDREPQGLNRLQSLRLALAAMVLAKPGLVLLDNPTAALPESVAMDLSHDIASWAKASNTIVVVASNRWQDWHAVVTQRWDMVCPDSLPKIVW